MEINAVNDAPLQLIEVLRQDSGAVFPRLSIQGSLHRNRLTDRAPYNRVLLNLSNQFWERRGIADSNCLLFRLSVIRMVNLLKRISNRVLNLVNITVKFNGLTDILESNCSRRGEFCGHPTWVKRQRRSAPARASNHPSGRGGCAPGGSFLMETRFTEILHCYWPH